MKKMRYAVISHVTAHHESDLVLQKAPFTCRFKKEQRHKMVKAIANSLTMKLWSSLLQDPKLIRVFSKVFQWLSL